MTFIKGQKPWNKGIPRPLEVRLKISQKRKGQHNSPKTEFKKGHISWNKNKNIWGDKPHPMLGKKHTKKSRLKIKLHHRDYSDKNNPMYEKHHSEETKQKISNSKRDKSNIKLSKTRKKLFAEGKLVPWNKGKHHMQKEKHPLWNKPRPEYIKNRISEGLKNWHKEHENPKSMLGKHHSEETKEKIGVKSRQLWKNPEFRERVIKNSLKGLFTRPTSLERKLIELIQKHNLPFKYCGNGSIIIGGFNPDFIECNGKKLLIETANRIHHNENYEKQRYAIFAKYGFRTLTLWWEDFFTDKYGKKMKENWEQNVLDKIKLFSYEP